MKIVISLILACMIGALCRWLDLPVPSPPKLLGALLVLAMTIGYLAADSYLSKKLPTQATHVRDAAARK